MTIKTLRQSKGLTQAELAEKVNVDQSAVSLWERGLTKPCRKYLPKLAEALEVSVEELSKDG